MHRSSYVLTCLLLPLFLLALAPSASAIECNQACYVELIKAVEGGTANTSYIRSQCGGHAKINRPARDVFKTGGSRNIPVTCHAALYMEENTSTLRTWWREYFEIQKNAPGANGAGFMGDEVLSPSYGHVTSGPIIVVLDEARKRGHTDVVNHAEDWLQAYWALSSLASRPANVTSHSAVIRNAVQSGNGNSSFFSGITSAASGARINSPLQGPASLIHPLLSLAADKLPRKYTNSVNNSPGFYGGLKVAAITAGYSIASNGRINAFGSRTAPLSKMGITQAQRNALKGFPGSGWQSHLPTLKAMVANYKPHCDMTFLRTTEGVISWFGTSTTEQGICNRNKGPVFAVRLDNDRTAEYLVPATDTRPSGPWRSYRDGNQICAANENYSGSPWCIDLPGGTVLYELSWTRSQGLKEVGTSTGPQIRVQADFVGTINPGGTLDYGSSAPATNQYVNRVIRIWNDGPQPMTVSASLTNTSGNAFSQLGQPASPIPAGGNSVFQVRLSRNQSGTFTGTVRINHNGGNTSSPFTFTVRGNISGGGQLPAGTLDRADCTSIAGWARDPDNTRALQVQIFKGTGTGSPVATVTANQLRSDLPFPDKNHGFSLATPAALKTGSAVTVSAFAQDIDFNGNPTGSRRQLVHSPKTITCAGGPQTITVQANADTWIAQEQPTTSNGSSTILRVRYDISGYGRRSFLRFQVPTIPGQILSARLKLRTTSGGGQQVGFYRMNNMSWTENSVTWANHLNPPTTFTFLRSEPNLAPNVTHAIDVTAGVAGSGPVTFGIASGSNLGGHAFYSRESGNKPVLEITYQP